MFSRVASFEAVANVPADRKVSKKSVAEIVAASPDGNTLVYTDGEQQGIGFIDIRNPSAPKAMGFVPVAGEPTSVVVSGGVVLAAVSSTKTSPGQRARWSRLISRPARYFRFATWAGSLIP